MIEALLIALLWLAIALAVLYIVRLVAVWILTTFNAPAPVVKAVDVVLGLIALYLLVVWVLLPLVHGLPHMPVR